MSVFIYRLEVVMLDLKFLSSTDELHCTPPDPICHSVLRWYDHDHVIYHSIIPHINVTNLKIFHLITLTMSLYCTLNSSPSSINLIQYTGGMPYCGLVTSVTKPNISSTCTKSPTFILIFTSCVVDVYNIIGSEDFVKDKKCPKGLPYPTTLWGRGSVGLTAQLLGY